MKRAKAAAATGQIRDLRRALEAGARAAEQLAADAQESHRAFDFDESSYLGSGDYAKELLTAADQAGVAMFEEDERLLCYPSLIRILPSEAAIEVDRRRERRLRPSVVIEHLAQSQQRPPRFRAEAFLESLVKGYDLDVAEGGKRPDAVVRLVDIWAILTLLPGQSRDYTRQEFAHDLYLLDQSGVTQTRSGRALRWHASTGTKGSGVLGTVARSGQPQRYWGISFIGQESS